MALEATRNGQGVALCGLSLVIDDLLAGKLIAPLGPASAVQSQSAYRLVQAPSRQLSDMQITFIRWIKTEASKTRQDLDDFLSLSPATNG